MTKTTTEQTYTPGLLDSDQWPGPLEIKVPDGFPLGQCYRLASKKTDCSDVDAINLHLLSALVQFDEPFVPVSESNCQDKDAYQKLPVITKVKVTTGKILYRKKVWEGILECVSSLTIIAYVDNGKVFSSAVDMAAHSANIGIEDTYEKKMFVTPAARQKFGEIWYHLGGFFDWSESDVKDVQREMVERELETFWQGVDDPDEPLRYAIMDACKTIKEQRNTISVTSSANVTICFEDGRTKLMKA